MSRRVQARKQWKSMSQTQVVKDDRFESMQHTINELQNELIKLKTDIEEEKVFKRDQLLMKNLHELRKRKNEGVLNRIINFTLNR